MDALIEQSRRSSRLSLVISTLGRVESVERLFTSLDRQTFLDFEVIIVDQNADDRLAPLLSEPRAFPIRRLHRPDLRGVSAGRNAGWRASIGETVIFPDDDCWYPDDFLTKGLAELDSRQLDLLSGRAATMDGRSINARFAKRPHAINRRNVWISQMEWMTFVRRSLLEELNGFDEMLGIGSPSPWQAAEGPDLILRALAKGAKCRFDPAIVGYHDEIELDEQIPGTRAKLRGYARAKGSVLRRYHYGAWDIAYWVARPMFNALRNLAAGRIARARCYFGIAVGRFEGWSDMYLGPEPKRGKDD